ncbi:hypothetical protein HXX76_009799 [Chlamydomonas incerta]|uniref:Uncharacterized protein n=1 Tax=Chlamydomonas incerta TaxID=51695 RepID=A0A835SPJ8_CHLIN|nr:hypothetical protein HXX76_009799 [Chlamydomonas incerta]|eukprot:KAG2430824.1 hypothetical protein HXX76_009799 [Chlamydomonas incerta]
MASPREAVQQQQNTDPAPRAVSGTAAWTAAFGGAKPEPKDEELRELLEEVSAIPLQATPMAPTRTEVLRALERRRLMLAEAQAKAQRLQQQTGDGEEGEVPGQEDGSCDNNAASSDANGAPPAADTSAASADMPTSQPEAASPAAAGLQGLLEGELELLAAEPSVGLISPVLEQLMALRQERQERQRGRLQQALQQHQQTQRQHQQAQQPSHGEAHGGCPASPGSRNRSGPASPVRRAVLAAPVPPGAAIHDARSAAARSQVVRLSTAALQPPVGSSSGTGSSSSPAVCWLDPHLLGSGGVVTSSPAAATSAAASASATGASTATTSSPASSILLAEQPQPRLTSFPGPWRGKSWEAGSAAGCLPHAAAPSSLSIAATAAAAAAPALVPLLVLPTPSMDGSCGAAAATAPGTAHAPSPSNRCGTEPRLTTVAPGSSRQLSGAALGLASPTAPAVRSSAAGAGAFPAGHVRRGAMASRSFTHGSSGSGAGAAPKHLPQQHQPHPQPPAQPPAQPQLEPHLSYAPKPGPYLPRPPSREGRPGELTGRSTGGLGSLDENGFGMFGMGSDGEAEAGAGPDSALYADSSEDEAELAVAGVPVPTDEQVKLLRQWHEWRSSGRPLSGESSDEGGDCEEGEYERITVTGAGEEGAHGEDTLRSSPGATGGGGDAHCWGRGTYPVVMSPGGTGGDAPAAFRGSGGMSPRRMGTMTSSGCGGGGGGGVGGGGGGGEGLHSGVAPGGGSMAAASSPGKRAPVVPPLRLPPQHHQSYSGGEAGCGHAAAAAGVASVSGSTWFASAAAAGGSGADQQIAPDPVACTTWTAAAPPARPQQLAVASSVSAAAAAAPVVPPLPSAVTAAAAGPRMPSLLTSSNYRSASFTCKLPAFRQRLAALSSGNLQLGDSFGTCSDGAAGPPPAVATAPAPASPTTRGTYSSASSPQLLLCDTQLSEVLGVVGAGSPAPAPGGLGNARGVARTPSFRNGGARVPLYGNSLTADGIANSSSGCLAADPAVSPAAGSQPRPVQRVPSRMSMDAPFEVAGAWTAAATSAAATITGTSAAPAPGSPCGPIFQRYSTPAAPLAPSSPSASAASRHQLHSQTHSLHSFGSLHRAPPLHPQLTSPTSISPAASPVGAGGGHSGNGGGGAIRGGSLVAALTQHSRSVGGRVSFEAARTDATSPPSGGTAPSAVAAAAPAAGGAGSGTTGAPSWRSVAHRAGMSVALIATTESGGAGCGSNSGGSGGSSTSSQQQALPSRPSMSRMANNRASLDIPAAGGYAVAREAAPGQNRTSRGGNGRFSFESQLGSPGVVAAAAAAASMMYSDPKAAMHALLGGAEGSARAGGSVGGEWSAPAPGNGGSGRAMQVSNSIARRRAATPVPEGELPVYMRFDLPAGMLPPPEDS